MNLHPHLPHHHPPLRKRHALSDPDQEQEWEIVPPDDWWRTSFTSVSWTYKTKLPIQSSKSKSPPSQYRGSLFLTETQAGAGYSKRLSSSPSASSSIPKPISSSPSTTTNPITLSTPRAHRRISEHAEQEREREIEDEVILNPDLPGVQTALDAVQVYEKDVGFHYSYFPDLGLVPPPAESTRTVDLSVDINEKDIQAAKDQWGEMLEDLMNGPAFESTTDSDESLESSFMGSISSFGSADSIPMPSTPKPKSLFASDIEIKATSPAGSPDGHGHGSASHLASLNFSPTKSLSLSATASSFVPTFCSQLNEEPLQFTPSSSSKETQSQVVHATDLYSPSTSSFLNFTFPTLNPTPTTTTTTNTTTTSSVKIKKDELGFFTSDIHSHGHIENPSSLGGTVGMASSKSDSDLLPPFLLQEPSSARSRSRKSRTREIVDRLRSRTVSAAAALGSAAVDGLDLDDIIGATPATPAGVSGATSTGGTGNGSGPGSQVDLSLGLISPNAKSQSQTKTRQKKYSLSLSHSPSPSPSSIGMGGDESMMLGMGMGLGGRSKSKPRLSVSEDGERPSWDDDEHEDGWIDLSSSSVEGVSVSQTCGGASASASATATATATGAVMATAISSSPPTTTATVVADEHEQKSKRTRELFMALRRRRTDSGSGSSASGENMNMATATTTTTTTFLPNSIPHSRELSMSSVSPSPSPLTAASALVSDSTSTSPSPSPSRSGSSPRTHVSELQAALDIDVSVSASSALGISTKTTATTDGDARWKETDSFAPSLPPVDVEKKTNLKGKDQVPAPLPLATSPSSSMSISPTSPTPPPLPSSSSPSNVRDSHTTTTVTGSSGSSGTKKRPNHNPGRSSVCSSLPSHQHPHPHPHVHPQYFGNVSSAAYYPQLSLSPIASSHPHPHTHPHTHTHPHILNTSPTAGGFTYFIPGYPNIPLASPYAASAFMPLPTAGVGVYPHQQHHHSHNHAMPMNTMNTMNTMNMMPMPMAMPHMNMNMMPSPQTPLTSMPTQPQPQHHQRVAMTANGNTTIPASYRAGSKHLQSHSHAHSHSPLW